MTGRDCWLEADWRPRRDFARHAFAHPARVIKGRAMGSRTISPIKGDADIASEVFHSARV
jgi:hypothetical protein